MLTKPNTPIYLYMFSRGDGRQCNGKGATRYSSLTHTHTTHVWCLLAFCSQSQFVVAAASSSGMPICHTVIIKTCAWNNTRRADTAAAAAAAKKCQIPVGQRRRAATTILIAIWYWLVIKASTRVCVMRLVGDATSFGCCSSFICLREYFIRTIGRPWCLVEDQQQLLMLIIHWIPC